MSRSKTIVLIIVCLALMALRIWLGASLPLCIHGEALYDDAWAVNAAESIVAGHWLGADYDDITLIKNPGFPLYMALLIKCGVSYLLGTSILDTLAAAFLALALRPLFKRNWTWLMLFIALLFNPVGLGTDTFMRVYRNSVTAAQVELIFGAYLGAYVRAKGCMYGEAGADGKPPRVARIIPWMVVGSIGLAWFWVSREDSIWVVPFVGVATLVICLFLLRCAVSRKRKGPDGTRIKRMGVGALIIALIFMLIPIGATASAQWTIEQKNFKRYGEATTAEIDSGEFSRFIKDLYAIKPAEMPENLRVACPHSSVEAAFELSPTLASIRDDVEDRFYNWGDKIDNNPGDGEVNGGEFFWVFRLAASEAGIYVSAPVAESFWGKCADEIERGFASGGIETRSVLPSSIMTPWRNEFAPLLLPNAAKIYIQACSYLDVTTMPWIAQGSSESINHFEEVTGDKGYRVVIDFAQQPSSEEYSNAVRELVAHPGNWPMSNQVACLLLYIYRVFGTLLGVFGLLALIILLIRWLGRRKDGPATLCCWAIFLGVLVLIAGLAYTRTSSFAPISYYYYGSAAYPLLMAMNITAIDALFRRRRTRKEAK